MSYHVISLRGVWPRKVPESFIYVGRRFAGLEGHELANPYTGQNALLEYTVWLHAIPKLDQMLRDLRSDTECGRHALACWCGNWKPGDPPLACHAYILAQELKTRYPNDLEGSYW